MALLRIVLFALAQEIITNCHFSRNEGILLKFDFEKAYAKVI